ncbi:ImmA/IrrE family metallo-endopeptidase [Pedobacter aquatilis]|uniref:ImmA/IrrE family metallo-endopeptidase n=1 Tax=Pedobacter aquatilis TaxID=351343 RepID=UPI0025B4E122|nr:ImmA/IrrE family metallo-endopeptidase [Pedobacter aquatilis]MDN3587171.1 ImmA/IrrE family metallo-endopeptidase [Pedobacter aquatilis]
MNTVHKGNTFEAVAHQILKEALESLKLGLIPSCCTIIPKPRYYALGTDEYIEFDLSIEVRIGENKDLSFLYIIECKDYADPIPVGKVEEFYSKVTQVTGLNVKGVLMTTSDLQNRAEKFAKSKNMMWIKVADNSPQIMLYNSKQEKNNLEDTDFIHLQNELQQLRDLQSVMFSGEDGQSFNWDELIYKFIKHAALGNLGRENSKEEPIAGLERLSHDLLEKMSEKILNQFDPNILKSGLALNLDEFRLHLQDTYGLEVLETVIPEKKGRKIYGAYDASNKRILIDEQLVSTDRYAFVLAHEIAHFFLHSNLKMGQGQYDILSDSEYDAEIGKHQLRNERHWVEWQANQLAACLLLPKISLMSRLIITQRQLGISKHGKIYCDNNNYNRVDFLSTMDGLNNYFKASKTVIEYRLADLRMIRYAPDFRRPNTSFTGVAKNTRSVASLIKYTLSKMEINKG